MRDGRGARVNAMRTPNGSVDSSVTPPRIGGAVPCSTTSIVAGALGGFSADGGLGLGLGLSCGPAAQRRLEAHEVAVGIGDEKLLHSGLFVSDAIPGRLERQIELDPGILH